MFSCYVFCWVTSMSDTRLHVCSLVMFAAGLHLCRIQGYVLLLCLLRDDIYVGYKVMFFCNVCCGMTSMSDTRLCFLVTFAVG